MINPFAKCSICYERLYGFDDCGNEVGPVIEHAPNGSNATHPVHLACKKQHFFSEGKNDLSCPECRTSSFSVYSLLSPIEYAKMRAGRFIVNTSAAAFTTSAMYISTNLVVRIMGAAFVKFQELALLFSSDYLIKKDLLKLSLSMVVIAPCQIGMLFLTGAFCFYSLSACVKLADRVGSYFRDYNRQIVATGVVGACAISISSVIYSSSGFSPAIPILTSAVISGYLAFQDKRR